MRNEVLKYSEMPDTYEVNGRLFNIRYNDSSYDSVYFNSTNTGINWNDWTTAGLMYWLNSKGTTDGYLKTLSNSIQEVLEETKYYLGNIVYDKDTPITAYEHERGSANCTPASSNPQCKGGDIFPNNSASWTGKVALMYPSDVGFSTSNSYWKDVINSWNNSQLNSSWLKDGHTTHEWLLSPSYFSPYNVAGWSAAGDIGNSYAPGYIGSRPALYLKSNVKIIDGDGSLNNQYKLTIE